MKKTIIIIAMVLLMPTIAYAENLKTEGNLKIDNFYQDDDGTVHVTVTFTAYNSRGQAIIYCEGYIENMLTKITDGRSRPFLYKPWSKTTKTILMKTWGWNEIKGVKCVWRK